jgi:Glycine zipper
MTRRIMATRTFRLAAVPLLAALSLGGCADLTPTQQRTGTGALGGAALGGLIGSFSGNAGWGALLGAGAGAGAGAGYLYDQSQQAQARAYYQGRADARRAARYGRGPYY